MIAHFSFNVNAFCKQKSLFSVFGKAEILTPLRGYVTITMISL